MSINLVFKKSLLLIIAAIILSLLYASNRVHATTETNLALNTLRTGYPSVSASFTCGCDNVWNAVDGSYSSNRWTTWLSDTQDGTDSFTIDFGSAKPFNQVKLYIYNDSGGVQPPASYTIQYWDDTNWINTINQTKTPVIPEAALYNTTPASILNTVNFDTVTSPKLKIIFTNGASYVGLVELEFFLHDAAADQSAASTVVTQIGQLPIQAALVLPDKPAVTAARTAYGNLSVSQKNLVTNLSRLTAAESAIAVLELALIPVMKEVTAVSAFSDATGHTITLKLESVLDLTYGLQADKFLITANAVEVTAASAVYDATDSNHQTIKLTFSSPVLLNETLVTLSLQSGVLKTSNNELNTAIHSVPVITLKKLDLSLDHLIGVDDIVQMIGNPASQVDVNQDGIFDRKDILILLGQISKQL